jgi:hypothetical protein
MVSSSALNLRAQSTHVADMETGTTITSLTNMKSHRHPPTPFGAIDGSADDGVALDVSVAPDSSGPESANQVPSGRASGQSVLRGSMPAQSVTPNLLQGRNLGGTTGSVHLANASSVQTPSAQTLQSASPKLSSLSTSFRSPQATSRQPLQSVGTRPQGGSTSSAPAASKINGPPAPGDMNSGRDLSGSAGSFSSLSSSRPHQSAPGAPARSSPSQEFASDSSPDDAFSMKMDAAPTGARTLTTGKREPTSFLETVKSPFAEQLKSPFAVDRRHFGMERVCGDECVPETSSRASESVTPDTSESARSIGRPDRSPSRLFGGYATLKAPMHNRHRFRREGASIRNSIGETPEGQPEGRKKPGAGIR